MDRLVRSRASSFPFVVLFTVACSVAPMTEPSDAAGTTTGGSDAGGGSSGGTFTGGTFAGGAFTGGTGATGGALATGGAPASGGAGGNASGGGVTLFDPCPAAPEPCRIMPSGDSITVGAQSTETGGYRVPLFRRARAAGKSSTFVGPSGAGPDEVDGVPFPDAHDGHSGYVIDTIGTRKGLLPLVEGNLEKHAPHVVLLLIGTNDVNLELELETAPARLAKVLDAMTSHAPNALVVVGKLPLTRTDELNLDVENYNAALADRVAERVADGKHLLLVDFYGAFTANGDYREDWLFDGLHPNDAGYAVMAEVWYEALEPYLH